MMTRLNLPHHNATLWLSDGTADRDLLEHATGCDIIDATPDGQLELAHEVVQHPIDITRGTSKSRAQAIVRGVLASHPTCRRVGIITHQTLTKSKLELGTMFDDRVAIVKHFHSGADRGSNEWHRAECDLIVVAGTPRIPTDEIRKLLFRCGELDALSSDGQWGDLVWQGFTKSGAPRIVKGRGFLDPIWRKVHRSKVRASIIQAAGRARALLKTGCDAVILSNEETGFPLITAGHEVEPMPDSETAVFGALSALVALVDISNGCACATSEAVAERCNLKVRQAQIQLAQLERRGLARRIGQRGGWRPTDDWFPRGEDGRADP